MNLVNTTEHQADFKVVLSDSDLLNWLQAQSKPGGKWICRKSSDGRGWRLHEISFEHEGAMPTAREALAWAMRRGETAEFGQDGGA